MNPSPASTAVDIQVTTEEQLLPEVADYARDKIRELVRGAHSPVRSARVRLTPHGDPLAPHSVVAQANLLAGGRFVRAQADGRNSWEAIDGLEDRLRYRLEHLTSRRASRTGTAESAGLPPWPQRYDLDEHPCWYPRPEEERKIVRHKSYTLRRCTVDDAARDMGMLDYDFHLFTEAGARRDAFLYRAGSTGYHLELVSPPGRHELAPFRLPVTISAQPPPILTAAEAVARLNRLGAPFLFFLDADRGRGAVLYRRYDGHYGLIVPKPGKPR